ncbi:NlpC/P60 family protein [Streptomyces sp. NPDC093085]|uniref:C40 family peptidase n=1 Tax=Streptomyces sp. NPDC093085 TaxID=3155068 RepID=UPI00342A0C81
MAAHRNHRKPRRRLFGGQAGRTAVTLALAGAATATAAGPAHTEPRLTPAEIKAKVDTLYEEAEAATERYNGAQVKADAARTSLAALRDEAARSTERLNTTRDRLGSVAAAQYRSGGLDPAVQLALTSRPEEYLERAGLAERAGSRQAAAVAGVRRELSRIAGLRSRADTRLTELKAHQAELARRKKAVQDKISAAERLLARLTAEERGRYEASDGPGAGPDGAYAARAGRGTPRATVGARNARAEAAVSFAYGAIGAPYVWGATGPGSFDCSGLTQAAYHAAGVALPRTTYTQINAGRRVSRAELAPGDLVFFYSGISHVGIYVGGGQMIHAPRPGTAVRLAPVDSMPFAGATRPV